MSERPTNERLAELAAQVGGRADIHRVNEHTTLLTIIDSEGEAFQHEVDIADDDDVLVQFVADLVEAGWTATLPALVETERVEYRLTFPGGAEAVLRAHSREEAIRLAGRGQPESIAP